MLTKALLPVLTKRKNGRVTIMNMASSAGYTACPFGAIYASSKAFDLFFSESLRKEINSKYQNMEVVTVCPMVVSSGMTNNLPASWKTGIISS